MEWINHHPHIFIISGKAQSGKDSVAQTLCEYYHDKKCIKISYAYYLKDYAKRILGWDGNEQTKPRAFLQQLGISLIQQDIDSHLLIRRICEDIEVFSRFYDIIIITDARLKEEIEIPRHKFQNVTVIRVNRKELSKNLTDEEQKHITETELDNYHQYDYIIDNQKDLEYLKKQVIQIGEELSL